MTHSHRRHRVVREARELERGLLVSELEVELLLRQLLLRRHQITHQTTQLLRVQFRDILNDHQVVPTFGSSKENALTVHRIAFLSIPSLVLKNHRLAQTLHGALQVHARAHSTERQSPSLIQSPVIIVLRSPSEEAATDDRANQEQLGHFRFRSCFPHECLRGRIFSRVVLLGVNKKSKTNVSHLHILQSLLQLLDSLVQSEQLLFTHNDGVFTMTVN